MDRLSFKLSIPYATLVVGVALTAIITGVYSWQNAWSPALDNVLKIVATGIGVTTALYAAMNFARLNRAHEETVELKKKELSAKFIERWLDPKMMETIQSIDTFVKQAPKLPEDELSARIESEHKLRHDCLFILNFFEALAVELHHDALHEPLMKTYFRGVVTTYFSNLKRVVELRRTRANNPRVFKELEDLASVWNK